MPKIPGTDKFTKAEVKRRLKSAKDYLAKYKTQRLLFLAPDDHLLLPCISLQSYDCENEYNYVSSIDLSEQLIRDCVKENRELFVDHSLFKLYNTIEYADEYYDALQRLFSMTCFCLFTHRKKEMTHKVVLCLGSLHHAPKIFYRDHRNNFYLEKLPAYDDLF